MNARAAQASPSTTTDYLSRLLAAWARAADESGETVVDLTLGPVSIELRIAGPALPAALLPPLERLRSNNRPASATIYAFDSASTGASPPPFRARTATSPPDERFRSAHQTYPGNADGSSESLAIFDAQARVGIFWVREHLHWSEGAEPLRALLHWALGGEDVWLMHASAVGDRRGAILMTGPGGSGKTTAALASLDAGLRLVGDNHVAVAGGGECPVVHGVYGWAKVWPGTLAQLPSLKSAVLSADVAVGEKLVVDVAGTRADALLDESPVSALVVPEVVDSGSTRMRPYPRAAALLALAPSTIFHAPRDGGSMAAMGALVRRVPCFKLDLGGNVADGPRELGRLLDRLAG